MSMSPVPDTTYGQAEARSASGLQFGGWLGPPGRPRPVGRSIVLALLTLGVYTYVWTFRTHKEIQWYRGVGLGGAVGLFIYLFALPATYFILPSEVEAMYEAGGLRSPISTGTGCWLFLPVVGSVIWFVKVQRALNRYWQFAGGRGRGSTGIHAP
jgi:hypothetical protein